jgi:PhnB protein
MKLHTYLSFNGNTRQAFEYYARHLGGNIMAMLTFGENPACESLPDSRDLIMHAIIDIGGHLVMGTDATPDRPYEGVRGAHVVIHTQDPAEADKLFAALADGGQVALPIQETFWAKRYGILVDRFGVPWMVNCAPEQ